MSSIYADIYFTKIAVLFLSIFWAKSLKKNFLTKRKITTEVNTKIAWKTKNEKTKYKEYY